MPRMSKGEAEHTRKKLSRREFDMANGLRKIIKKAIRKPKPKPNPYLGFGPRLKVEELEERIAP